MQVPFFFCLKSTGDLVYIVQLYPHLLGQANLSSVSGEILMSVYRASVESLCVKRYI